MAATTPNDIINEALVQIGVIQPGGAPSTAVQTAIFLQLVQMWAGWSTEELMAYVLYHQVFTLTAGTSVYTLGTGGTLVATARPVRVTSAVSSSGNQRNPVDIVSWDQVNAIPDPLGSRTIFAKAVGVDYAYPSLNVKVWPTPDTAPASLELDYWSPLVPFASVSASLDLPDGYERALYLNLAAEIYPAYSRTGYDPTILLGKAQEAKGVIASKNAQVKNLAPAPQQQAQQ